MTLRMAALPLALLVVLAVGISVYFLWNDDPAPATPEEWAAEADAQKRALLDALSDGGTLRVTVEDYQRDRLNPEGIVPPSLRLPDRVVRHVNLEVDSTGAFGRMTGETHGEDGALLSLERRENGRHVIEHPETGESYEFPAPVAGNGVSAEDWLDGVLGDPVDRLIEQGREQVGTGTLNDSESLIFQRTFSLGGSEDRRVVFEFSRENPVISRASTYRVLPDGSSELISEMTIISIEAIPN